MVSGDTAIGVIFNRRGWIETSYLYQCLRARDPGAARRRACPASARGPETAAQAKRSMIARARETLFGRREDDEPQEYPQAAE